MTDSLNFVQVVQVICIWALCDFINEVVMSIMCGPQVRKRDKEIIHLYEKE